MADEFEPRRADPGQEFGYTASETKTLDADATLDDEQVAAGWLLTGFDPETGRREITRQGVQKTIKADDSGVVRPKSQEEVAVLDTFSLPVARSVKAAEKQSEASGEKKES